MPAPPVAVVVVATIAGLAAIAAFTEFVYKPHIHPEVARWLEERRRRSQRRYAPPHPGHPDDRGDGPAPRPPRNRGRGRDDNDDDDDIRPLLSPRSPLSPRSRQPQQRGSQPGTPRTPASMRTRVDSDEERYGPPFDARRRPQGRDNIELADLAPEVREWRRHDMEDAATLRRRNIGHTSPSGSVGTPSGVGRTSASSVTPRSSGNAVVHEPTRPQEASSPFLPYVPYRPRTRGSPASTIASTLTSPSPVSATPIATGAATATLRSPPPSRLPATAPAVPRVERHDLDTTVTTHVIADPEDYSPLSGSANTTAPGTPNMASNSILRGPQLYPQLQQDAVVGPTSGSVLFSRDGQGLYEHGRQEQEQQGTGERRAVVGPASGVAVPPTNGATQARPTSPAHTDLSSLVTSPLLRTLPAITGTTTPLAPVPVRGPITRISGLESSNAATPRGATAVPAERTSPALHRSTGSSPISATLASFQTATTALGSPPYSPSSIVSSGLGGRGSGSGMGESIDTLTTPVQASYSHSPTFTSTFSPSHRSPSHPGGPAESTLTNAHIPSLSQTYHPQDLDYERGVVLLSPPSSRSESPFSVVSNTGSPGSRSPALSTGTNYMSLDGSIDLNAGFGRSPLVPHTPSAGVGAGVEIGVGAGGSPVQAQSHHIPPHSPPSSITFDDSDFDLLSATNSPYSMSPFASPHIGTIRHSTGNNINANAMSPPMLYHHPSPPRSGSGSQSSGPHSGPHSPAGHRFQNNLTYGSPALQRATSPTTSTTSTSISDIDFLDDDDSLGFNSDGWVSDHNQTSRR